MSGAKAATFSGYGMYWRTWTFLLIMTAFMLVLDAIEMPHTPFVLLMLAAMSIKATLIAGVFMHLKQESLDLVIAVGVCLIGCVALLYGLTVIDAGRIFRMLVA